MEGENRKQQKHWEGCSELQGISLTPPRRGPVSHGHSQLSAGNGESHTHPSAPQRAWEASCTHPALANAPQRSWERWGVLLGRCSPALHLEVAVGTRPSWMPPPARRRLKPSQNDLRLAATTWKPPNPSPCTDFSPKRGRKALGGGLSCSTQTRTAQGCSPSSRSCPGACSSLCSVPKPQLVQGREACEVRNAGGLGRMEQLSLWKPLDIQHFICFQPAWAAALGSRTGGSSLT